MASHTPDVKEVPETVDHFEFKPHTQSIYSEERESLPSAKLTEEKSMDCKNEKNAARTTDKEDSFYKDNYTMECGGSFTELALGLIPVKHRASFTSTAPYEESNHTDEQVDVKPSPTTVKCESPSTNIDIGESTLGSTLAKSLKLISNKDFPEASSPDSHANHTSEMCQDYDRLELQSVENTPGTPISYEVLRNSSCENSPVLTISHDDQTNVVANSKVENNSPKKKKKKRKGRRESAQISKNMESPMGDSGKESPLAAPPLRKKYVRKSKEKNVESVAEPTSEMDKCVMLFQCEVCYKVFNRKQTLRQHFITHTDRFACSFCNMRCKSKGDLRTHTQTHTKEKPYHCGVCNTFYTRESILKKHLNTQIHKKALISLSKKKSAEKEERVCREVTVPEKSLLFGGLSCSSCPKVFLSKKQLRKHNRVHLLKFKCLECNKRCMNSALLALHMKCHIKPHSLACNVCSRSFANLFLLKEHKKVHSRLSALLSSQRVKQDVLRAAVKHHNKRVDETNGRVAKWSCQQCGKAYMSERTLENHMKTHKEMKCSMCNKTFSSLSKLHLHMKFHIKPHICEPCNVSFLDIEEYHQHMETEHIGDNDLKCKICYQLFVSTVELESHMRNHAPTMLFSGASLDESSIPTSNRSKKLQPHLSKQELDSPECCKDEMSSVDLVKRSTQDSDDDVSVNPGTIQKLLREVVIELRKDCSEGEQEDLVYESDEELFIRIQRNLDSDLLSSDASDVEDQSPSGKPVIFERADIERKHRRFFALHEDVNLGEKIFKCKLCSLFFAGWEDLHEHMLAHVCEFCNIFFVDKSDLVAHRNEHKAQVLREIKSESRRVLLLNKNSLFPSDGSDSEYDEESDGFLSELESVLNCTHSGQKSKLRALSHDDIIRVNKKMFEKHSCIDADNNIFACTICKRKYARPTTLTRHLKTHVCPYCNQFFEDKVDLLEHKYRHRKAAANIKSDEIIEKEKVLASPLITKVNRDLIKKFTLIDKENKINRCTLCCKNFVRRTVLTRHMKTHICSMCDKFYEDKYDLAKHQASHRDQYKYRENDLAEFAETCVEKPLQSPCPEDGKLVSLAPSLSNISHFGSAYPVQNSGSGENQTLTFIQLPETNENSGPQMFTATAPGGSSFQIISEPDTNPASFLVTSSTGSAGEPGKIISISQPVVEERLYQCGDCSKHFFNEDHLKDHLMVHSKAKPYVCHLCGKAFSRATAMRKHEKTHMKRCKICDTAFSYKYELDLHMEMHRTYTF